MRKTALSLASVTLAMLLASGVALGVTSTKQRSGHPIEPEWMDEPVAAPGGSVQASLFARHWTSVTPEETLVYVDGRLVGEADEFDGMPTKLYLRHGKPKIRLEAPWGSTWSRTAPRSCTGSSSARREPTRAAPSASGRSRSDPALRSTWSRS